MAVFSSADIFFSFTLPVRSAIMYRGRDLTSRYSLPTYSPMIPRQRSCTPHKKQIIQVIEAQQVTVLPEKYLTNDQIVPAKLSSATALPSPVIS